MPWLNTSPESVRAAVGTLGIVLREPGLQHTPSCYQWHCLECAMSNVMLPLTKIRLLYCVFARRADKTGLCWLSKKRLGPRRRSSLLATAVCRWWY